MTKLTNLYGAVAAAAVIMSGIQAASATVCFDPSSSCPTSGEMKIFLNAGTGTSGTGQVGSQSGTPTVDFLASQSVDLANGFANIKPDTGKSFGGLKITVPGFTFTDMLFDVQMYNNKDATTLGFTVSAFDGATLLGSKTYTGLNHDADLSFIVTSTTPMTEIDLGLSSGFKEVKHFQISGVAAPVPLPGAASLLVGSIVGLGALGFRRKA